MLRAELQQDREAESRGVALSGDKVALFVQDRPVLDQLVDVHPGSGHLRQRLNEPSRSVARPFGMKRSRLTVIALLASLCACGQSGAGPMFAVASTETIVLPRADQPTPHRPTLERLKREAASSGRPLEEVVKRYAARVAATSSPRPTDFDGYDPAVTEPDVTIDGIPYAELVDIGTIAKSEGISYEEAIDRFGAQSSNSRVIDKLNAEFPDEISGVGYVDDHRGCASASRVPSRLARSSWPGPSPWRSP